jgi:putative ATP-dependent endonuclease of OLD family
LNSSTLEVEVARSRELGGALLSILEEEEFGALRRARIAQWKADVNTIDGEQLLSMVADIGKGRLAGRLAKKAIGLEPPTYIAEAIKQLVPHD